MFDNRPAKPPLSAADLENTSYVSLALAANALYARRHGYRFLFYNFSETGCRHAIQEAQSSRVRQLPMTWCKLQALEDALFGRQPCQLVLLLDSDAVVSNTSVRLEDFVSEHGRGRSVIIAHLDNETMSMSDDDLWRIHGIQSRHPWMFFSQPGGGNFVNAGVMIFQRGDGRKMRKMLEAWWNSAPLTPPELVPGRPRPCWGDCLKNWPHEQAVFEIFVWPRFREDVALVPLGLMNGFSGQFVRHVWGLVRARRNEVLVKALAASAAAATLPELTRGALRPPPAAA